MERDLSASVGDSGDVGLIPGSGRSSGGGNGNPLQYSCLENPMDRGDLWATIHGVTRVGHDLATEQHQQYTQQKESHVFTKRHTQKYS